ncbi:hypothetical protein ACQ4M3_19295 [Leptolyngbya sp. AN03gr2]
MNAIIYVFAVSWLGFIVLSNEPNQPRSNSTQQTEHSQTWYKD